MNGTRFARNTSAGLVAAIAAIASYSHMRSLAAVNGQPAHIAMLLPVSVDGLMVVASVAMVDDKAAGYRPRRSAWFAFVTGVVASIAANVLAAPPTVVARVISAWPALALLLVVELLTRRPRRRLAAPVDTVMLAPEFSVTPPEFLAEPVPVPAAPVADESPAPVVPAPRRAGRRPSAADRVVKAVNRKPTATPAEVAARLGLSERTVQRHWPRTDDTTTTPDPVPAEVNGHRAGPVELVRTEER